MLKVSIHSLHAMNEARVKWEAEEESVFKYFSAVIALHVHFRMAKEIPTNKLFESL